MDHKTEHEVSHWSLILMRIGMFFACVMIFCVGLWMIFSKQDSKLYEADGVVCASQPLQLTCWERKPR